MSSQNLIFDERTVIVLDNSNYKAEYAEEVPFKARVIDVTDFTIDVVSLVTEKRYELYYTQILEALDIGIIKRLIDFKEYGKE